MADAYQNRKLGLAETGSLLHMKPSVVYDKAATGALKTIQYGDKGRVLFTQEAVEGYASRHGIKLSSGTGKMFNLFDAAEKVGVSPSQLKRDARAGNVAYSGFSQSLSDAAFTAKDLIEYSRFRRGTQKLL
jgi:hypothetical protein